MNWNAALSWRLGTASLALLAAVAVYCFVRLNPPALLQPFQVTHALPQMGSSLFGSAPSFLYTLAFGLFIGSGAATLSRARLHCLLWITLALVLELSQASIIARPLAAWLTQILPGTAWELVGPYWLHGVFDPFDLLATLAGGALALKLLTPPSPGETYYFNR
jgi:hypothetical protein